MLFAGLFGGSKWMDCFYLAFKVPNLLRDLFAEGALSQAFVTTFSKKLKLEGEQSAWALANKMMTLAAVFMSLVTLLGIGIAPWIVEPHQTHPWVGTLIGLDVHPMTARSFSELTTKADQARAFVRRR